MKEQSRELVKSPNWEHRRREAEYRLFRHILWYRRRRRLLQVGKIILIVMAAGMILSALSLRLLFAAN